MGQEAPPRQRPGADSDLTIQACVCASHQWAKPARQSQSGHAVAYTAWRASSDLGDIWRDSDQPAVCDILYGWPQWSNVTSYFNMQTIMCVLIHEILSETICPWACRGASKCMICVTRCHEYIERSRSETSIIVFNIWQRICDKTVWRNDMCIALWTSSELNYI